MKRIGMSRRDVLAWGGGATMLGLMGRLLYVVERDTPSPDDQAFAPWRNWDDPAFDRTPLALVAAGALAANPHNTQAWRFRVTDDSIEIYADLSRNLGAMDTYLREMFIGLGCVIENMILVAGRNAFSTRLDVVAGTLEALTIRQGLELAATIHLSRGPEVVPSELVRAIPHRHTNRFAYRNDLDTPRAWLDSAARACSNDQAHISLISDGLLKSTAKSVISDATAAIIDDNAMIADSDRWLRSTARQITMHRDGPTLEAAGLSPVTYWVAKGFPVSADLAHRGWLYQTRDVQLATAQLLGCIQVHDRYDRASAIAAGRAWQRLHLSATVRGIAMQPLNQPIEMIDRERVTGAGNGWEKRVAALTGSDRQATFVFRAGMPQAAAPASPRRSLRETIWQR